MIRYNGENNNYSVDSAGRNMKIHLEKGEEERSRYIVGRKLTCPCVGSKLGCNVCSTFSVFRGRGEERERGESTSREEGGEGEGGG